MNVKVVTDSTSDIPPDLARALDIRVVPIYLRFGDKVYRDGVDISSEEFYRKLAASPVHPATSQPTPEDFTAVYSEYCGNIDGIVSIHISSKISGTYNSAKIARNMMESRCPIEVIDSKFNSAGLALVVMAAARIAAEGKSLQQVLAETRQTISQVHMFGMFDTMKYLARSGRVSKAIVAAANILNVKPLLTFHDGDIVRAGLVRSAGKGADRIYDFVAGKTDITEMIIIHSAVPDQAERLKKRLAWLFPKDLIQIMELGAGLGVHGGPGVLLVALR